MADPQPAEIPRDLDALFRLGTLAGRSDRELLKRFRTRRDESAELAFAALVARHGPMVLRVCGRLLDPHDSHDAFQATFLVLARKAGSLDCRDTLGPYLHAVALRVASGCRSASARRRRHERGYAERAATTYEERPPDDLARVLHEELGRLPDRFRSVAVLCDLEGMTCVQAAGRLGCPPGTVMSRLAEARRRLRARLLRRGLAPSASVLAAALAVEARAVSLPPNLAQTTTRAALALATGPTTPGTIASTAVLSLTEGVLRSMLITKLKVLVPMGLVGTLVATGAWVMAQAQPADLIRIPPLPSALDSFRPSAKTPALGPGQAEAGAASKKGAVLPKARASIKKTRLDTSGWPKFANAAGWNWMINPSRFRFDGGGITQSSDHRYMVVDAVVDAASGGLRILIVKVDAGPPLSRPYDLQVVAFDAAGRRYLFKQANITHQGQDRNGNFSVWHTSFTLDPKMLSPEKVAFLGVETKAAMMR